MNKVSNKWVIKPTNDVESKIIREWFNELRTEKYVKGNEKTFFWHYPHFEKTKGNFHFCYIDIHDSTYKEINFQEFLEITNQVENITYEIY